MKTSNVKTKKEYAEFNRLLHNCVCAVDDSQSVYNFQHLMFFDNMAKAKVNRLMEWLDKAISDTELDAILFVIDREEYITYMCAIRGMQRGILSYGEEQGWKLTRAQRFR